MLGPGSLFTSVLAACVVPEIRERPHAATRAQRSMWPICASNYPRPPGFDVAGLVASLREHEVPVDVVLADDAALPLGTVPDDVSLVVANVASEGLREHDPDLFGTELSRLLVG